MIKFYFEHNKFLCTLFFCFTLSSQVEAATIEASYPFLVNLEDTTDHYAAATLRGNPTPPAMSSDGICQNGIYIDGVASGGQSMKTPNIIGLDENNFQIDIEFKLTGFNSGNSSDVPVIIIGSSYRWFGLSVQSAKIGITYNNGQFISSNTSTALDVWNAVQIQFKNGDLRMFLNGDLVIDENIGALDTGSKYDFTTSNFGRGTALNGCIRNLKIFKDIDAEGTICTPIPAGTVSSNLDIHIPSLNYETPSETLNIQVDFEFHGEGENGELLWKLKDFAANPCTVL